MVGAHLKTTGKPPQQQKHCNTATPHTATQPGKSPNSCLHSRQQLPVPFDGARVISALLLEDGQVGPGEVAGSTALSSCRLYNLFGIEESHERPRRQRPTLTCVLRASKYSTPFRSTEGGHMLAGFRADQLNSKVSSRHAKMFIR